MAFIKRPLYIGALAGAALLGTTALVSAQQGPEKGREPLARDKGSESKGTRPDSGMDQPKTGDRPDMGGSKGAERPDKDRPKGAERPDKDRPKGAERPDKDRPKGAERPDKDGPKGAERPDKDRPKGAERPDKDRPKGAERPDKDRPKGAERPQDMDKDRPKGAERPQDMDKDRTKGAEGPDKAQPKGVRLSEQQRTEVSTKLRQTQVEKTRIQVNVRIGAHIPRSIRLYPLPATIVAVVPGYRGYSYFVREDDTIVIVDTRSYVVVEVIPASTRSAGLRLTPEQMRFILLTVPKDQAADVRLRLALGAEVPAHVELLPFPSEIRVQVPEVEGYRYIIADGDVVIIDPRNRDIALIISD